MSLVIINHSTATVHVPIIRNGKPDEVHVQPRGKVNLYVGDKPAQKAYALEGIRIVERGKAFQSIAQEAETARVIEAAPAQPDPAPPKSTNANVDVKLGVKFTKK
jgi:hypothetical protein